MGKAACPRPRFGQRPKQAGSQAARDLAERGPGQVHFDHVPDGRLGGLAASASPRTRSPLDPLAVFKQTAARPYFATANCGPSPPGAGAQEFIQQVQVTLDLLGNGASRNISD